MATIYDILDVIERINALPNVSAAQKQRLVEIAISGDNGTTVRTAVRTAAYGEVSGVVRAALANGPLSLHQLLEATGRTKSQVSGALKSLQGRGIVVATPSDWRPELGPPKGGKTTLLVYALKSEG